VTPPIVGHDEPECPTCGGALHHDDDRARCIACQAVFMRVDVGPPELATEQPATHSTARTGIAVASVGLAIVGGLVILQGLQRLDLIHPKTAVTIASGVVLLLLGVAGTRAALSRSD
jgi:hypothetical protein